MSLLLANSFRYFDSKGERQFPTLDEVKDRAKNKQVVVLVLDSNVCLNLSNYARGLSNPHNDSNLRLFLLAAEYTKVDIAPFFGCLELSSTPHKPDLDTQKLNSLAKHIYAAIHQSESSIVEGQNPHIREWESEFSDTIDVLLPILTASYACYLKISTLLQESRKRIHALKHLSEYLDWIEKFRLHISIPTQAALALFGGAHEAQTLLRDDKNRTKCSIAWGAAWDTVLAWIVQNYLTNRSIDGVQQYPIFVTDDAAAAFVAGKCVHIFSLTDKDHPILSTMQLSIDFPHFKHQIDQALEIANTARQKQQERLIDELGLTKENKKKYLAAIEEEIRHLEVLLGCQESPA